MYRIILIILFSLFGFSLKAQTKFSKFYDNNISGSKVEDQGRDFITLADSGYLFPTFSGNLYAVDTLGFAKTFLQIIRTNKEGDTIYRKLYRKKNFSISVSYITSTLDGNYMLAGYIFDLVKYKKDSTGAEILLVKINENGDTLWTKTVGIGDGDELVNRLIRTKDGGFAIFGQTCDKKETNCDFYLMKVDSNGNKLWHQKYSLFSNSWEMPWDMIETLTGEFLLAGYIHGGIENFIVKTDSAGNKLWKKSFPKDGAGSISAFITNVVLGDNNTYLFAGSIGGGG